MKISVIIPIYNTEALLGNCLESVRNQTYQDLEVILVDDGSTDGSGRICEAYAEMDARFTVIHKPNGGVSSARNAGLRAAHGDFIGFVDSDDHLAPGMYETLMFHVMSQQAQIACCPVTRLKPGQAAGEEEDGHKNSKAGTAGGTLLTFEHAQCLQAFLDRKYLGFNIYNKIYRKDILKHEFREDMAIAEDAMFLFQAVLEAARIVYTDQTRYYYYSRPGSATQSGFSGKMFGILDFTDHVFETVAEDHKEMIGTGHAFVYYKYLALMNNLLYHDMERTFQQEYQTMKARLGETIRIVRKTGKISKRNLYSYYLLKHTPGLYKIILKLYFRNRNLM